MVHGFEFSPPLPSFILDGQPIYIEQEIAQGGSAVIYKGQEGYPAQLCAIKVVDLSPGREPPADMSLDDIESQSTIHLLNNEAMHRNDCIARNKLQAHPNIVGVRRFGIVRQDNRSFFIATMELCEHPDLAEPTLSEMLKLRGALQPLETVMLFRQIASAVQYTHDNDMVHNDLTSSNILLKDDVTPLLTDFALVGKADAAGRCPWTPNGTRRYQAPEATYRELSFRTDQYALAVILYEMLTGKLPFTSEETMLTAYYHMAREAKDFVQVTGFEQDTRDALWPVIQCALSKDPYGRFATVQALSIALEDALLRALDTDERALHPKL